MNSRRIVILVASILVGGLAAFGLLRYVDGVESDVYAGAEVGTVWVASEPIPKGTPASQAIELGMLVPSELPVQYRPATAISDPALQLDGALVAIVDLPVNHVLVEGNFVPTSVASTSVTDRLEERGMVTVTLTVDQVAGAAFMIQPGDFVNILTVPALVDTEEEEAPASNDEDAPAPPSTPSASVLDLAYANQARYLYQRVEVLAVDQSLPADLGVEDEESGSSGNPGLITLAVPPEAVQHIVSIKEQIYLSLVPPSYEPVPLAPLDVSQTLLCGEDIDCLTPYGPGGSADEGESAGTDGEQDGQ